MVSRASWYLCGSSDHETGGCLDLPGRGIVVMGGECWRMDEVE
jgi:hypothetical protein